MSLRQSIELHCKRSDARTFEQLGFIRQKATQPGKSLVAVKMTCPAVDEIIVSTLVALGQQGKPFTAKVIGLDQYTSLLIASYGKEVITVPTIGYWREPVVRMDQDGQCAGEDARKYWSIKATFEEALALEEVTK